MQADNDDDKILALPKWVNWIQGLWFVRGAIAAFSIMTISSDLLNLTRFEFLEAFHAIVVSWNIIVNYLCLKLAYYFPYIPVMSAEIVNSIILTSVVVPGLYSWMSAEDVVGEGETVFTFIFQTFLFSIFSAVSIYYILFTDYGNLDGVFDYMLYGLIILMFASAVFAFIETLLEFASIRGGIIFSISVVVFLEIFYHLGHPEISIGIKDWTCETLKSSSNECSM